MCPFCKTALPALLLAPSLLAETAFAHPPRLAAPPRLTATAAYRQVTLSWSASIGARGYTIFRGRASGRESAVALAVGVSGPPFVDTGLTNGVRYFYKVQALGGAGPSVASEASGTPSVSGNAGYYLTTYWAGNSVTLGADENGDAKIMEQGPRDRSGPAARSGKILTILTYQPSNASDEPPSCIILKASRRDDARPGHFSVRYSAVNNPGRRFTLPDSPAPPAQTDRAAQAEREPPPPAGAPAPPPSAVPLLTPYQINPSLFAGQAEAARALESQDTLLRRSGVEWLGRWTQTDGGGGPPGRETARRAFHRMTGLVPALTRGVSEMPNWDSDQAARLLALLGTPARSAIPAVCAALARPSSPDSLASDKGSLLCSLTRLCGGPYSLAPVLVGLLHSREPDSRRAVAAALRFCDDPLLRHTSPSWGAYPDMPPGEEKRWHETFLGLAFPAITACLEDDAADVRVAAAQTLEQWTYFPDIPWPSTLRPLAQAAASPDPALRQASLRALAFMPGDISPAAPALRAALHGNASARGFAWVALSHAAWTDRARTLDAFLPDLAAPEAARRRAAAADIHLASSLFWDGGGWPGPDPLPQWQNDSRLMRVSTPPDPTAAASQMRLLAALVHGVADLDPAVRRDAAGGLEQIGQETDRMQAIQWRRAQTPEVLTGKVTAALAQAASLLLKTDPAAAKRLQAQAAQITGPHVSF